jgi:toxin ParE1/3/4
MAFRIKWQPQAIEDLDMIRKYFKLISPRYAKSIVEKMKVHSHSLKYFPLRSRAVPELKRKEIREIFIDSYRMIYAVRPGKIDILAIVHMSRDLTNVKII